MRLRLALLLVFLTCACLGQSAHEAKPPEVLLIAPPKYPPLARQAQIQGTVAVQVQLDASGSVQHLHIIQGHPVLTDGLFDSLEKWQFSCPSAQCATRFTVTFQFVLAGQRGEPQPVITLDLPSRVLITAHPPILISDDVTIQPPDKERNR